MRRFLPVLLSILAVADVASGHPLGNLSINQLSRIELLRDRITVEYMVDFAEIPTFQMFTKRGNPAFGDLDTEVARLASSWMAAIVMDIDGETVALSLDRVQATELSGEASLTVVRAVLRLSAPWQPRAGTLTYRDGNFGDRIGWKSVVVQTDGAVEFPAGNRYATDQTEGLTQYPESAVAGIPNVRRVALRIAPVESAAAAEATGAGALREELRWAGLIVVLGLALALAWRGRLSRGASPTCLGDDHAG